MIVNNIFELKSSRFGHSEETIRTYVVAEPYNITWISPEFSVNTSRCRGEYSMREDDVLILYYKSRARNNDTGEILSDTAEVEIRTKRGIKLVESNQRIDEWFYLSDTGSINVISLNYELCGCI
jgi:hypothetical protein